MLSLVETLDGLPPLICRLLAKHNGRLASDREMMRRTHWSWRKLARLQVCHSYAGFKASDIDTFHEACGVRWSAKRIQRWYLATRRRGDIFGMHHMRLPRKSAGKRHWRRLAGPHAKRMKLWKRRYYEFVRSFSETSA